MSQADSHQKNEGREGRSFAVSVIIPAFNSAAYISETLASVFAQTFSDYEVVVVDDGSPDADELERAIEPYRDRIVYVRQENRGPGAARNTAILKAQGEYIAFLDSDDVWLPRYLAEQIKTLRADPSLDFICSDAILFGDSVPAGRTYMETTSSRGPVSFESLMQWGCLVLTSCTIARRQSLIDVGLFDERAELISCEDFDLWLRLALHGCRMNFQQEVLARRRLGPASLGADSLRMLKSKMKVLRKVERSCALPPARRESLALQIARCDAYIALEYGKQSFEAQNFDQAAEALERANAFFRSGKLRVALLCLRAAPRLLRLVYKVRNRALPAFTVTLGRFRQAVGRGYARKHTKST